jgi:hypothetical protein
MRTALAAALLIAATGVFAGPAAETSSFTDELGQFVDAVRSGELREPQRHSVVLPEIVSRSGNRRVAPSLDVVAGRLDAEHCLYQLRLELHWSGRALHDDDAAVGGRSLIQQAPCATLTQEVLAVAAYEVSALNRRLREGGRAAVNQERDQIIAAARRLPTVPDAGATLFAAVTVDSRVNLRMSPSLKAPVLAKLAPASMLHVVPTANRDWFLLQGRPGYLHVSALQSVEPAAAAPPPEPVTAALDSFVAAEVGNAHLAVRESPSLAGRVVGRLRPGAPLRLAPAEESGWFELEDGSGYVHESGLLRAIKTAARFQPGGISTH